VGIEEGMMSLHEEWLRASKGHNTYLLRNEDLELLRAWMPHRDLDAGGWIGELEGILIATCGIEPGKVPDLSIVQALSVLRHKPRPTSEGAPRAGSQTETIHSEDFTSVKWFGQHYCFTKTQALCIRHLWTAWEKGGLGLSQATIGEKIGTASNRFRLLHVFRSKKEGQHPAWGKMIRTTGKGIYALFPPNHQ